jgi:amphi-Trp domain-containing protein
MERSLTEKYEERLSLSRAEVAARLRTLSDQIAAGALSLGSVQSPVADRANYEIELKADQRRGRLEIEIEWR